MNSLFENLREVVFLCSSSRGGSSITAEWLRQHKGLLHLRAEINPLLNRAKLVFPYSSTSDELTEHSGTQKQRNALWCLFVRDFTCNFGNKIMGHIRPSITKESKAEAQRNAANSQSCYPQGW